MNPKALQRFLLDPASYPQQPAKIVSKETHISRLFFTPERVYKIKKPVAFDFLDFTTLARRRHFCHEEVRLNRRFAPDTYEGVVAIRTQDGKLAFDGTGRAVEYAVVMKRLPEERFLSNLLEDNAPELPQFIDRLGRHLAKLHRDAPIVYDADATAILQRNWEENFTQTQPLTGPTLSPEALQMIRAWVAAFLSGRRNVLQGREVAGWIRDGHGDLHAEHICMTEPIRIYDCIEFNRRFRIGDILSDLAFLLMDMEFRGQPHLAERLLRAWDEELAIPSPPDNGLLLFYRLYRAFVRGKVDTFLAIDPAAPEEVRDNARRTAQCYFNLALGYLAPPVMILTCGLMGVGKSTMAQRLARALRADLIRSDAVRKELAGVSASSQVADDFASGLYSPAWNERTYAALIERSTTALAAGRSVIVDASFGRAADRKGFSALARQHGRPLLLLHLIGSRDLLLQRLILRGKRADDPSDGRPELLSSQARVFEPPDAEETPLEIDAERELDYNVQTVLVQVLSTHGANAA